MPSLAVQRFAAGAAAAALASILAVAPSGCQCQDCPFPLDPALFCTSTARQCTLGGAPVTCPAGLSACIITHPAPGATIGLPLGAMASVIGTRRNLWIKAGCEGSLAADAGGDAGDAKGYDDDVAILFDQMPATGCRCDAARGPIVCKDIPTSVRVLSVTFANGASNLELAFHDSECEATHHVCEL